MSNRLISGGTDLTAWRLPAAAFEAAIAALMADHLESCASQQALVVEDDIAIALQVSETAASLASDLRARGIKAAARFIACGRITRGTITMDLNAETLGTALDRRSDDINPNLLTISAPFTCRRRGAEVRIIAGDPLPTPDTTLIRTLAAAHRWAAALRSGTPLGEIARREGHAGSYIRTRAQLAFLSPKIQVAILNGTQPLNLTVKRLMGRPIPIDWNAQMQLYGM